MINRHAPLLFLSLLTLISAPLYAQEAEVPWPLRPEDIFTDAVELVEMSVTPEFDNDARTVRVYDVDTQAWREFPYPDEFDHITNINNRNETLILTVVEHRDYAADSLQWTPYTLNLETGQFAPYGTSCLMDNAYFNASSYWIPGSWVFYIDARSRRRTALCNLATGELRGFLPPQVPYWWSLSESPTGEWLILSGGTTDFITAMSVADVYAYEIASDTLRYMGEMPIREVSRDQQWISDIRAIFYRGFMPEWGEKDYYAFDVTQENSMVSFTGWARYQENPTRYEYLQTYYELTHRSDAPGYPWCEIMVYNPLTMTAQTYTLAHDCFGRVMWDGRRYFYASYTSDNSDGLTLYSLDIETGETTAWVTRSDLMALDSLSPDGRYVVMMLNDGQRANIEGPYPPYVELDPFIYEGPFTSYFAIFDTFEGRWVYETDNWQGSIADWIDSNTFLWFGWETPSTAHIFQIDDTGVTEIGQINNVVAQISPLSPDRHFLLIWNENESARNSLNAFDVQNQRELSLVYWPDPEHYYVALNWAGEHNVTLTIYQSIDGRVDNRKSVTYVINYP